MQALVTNVATFGCSRTGEVPSLQLHDDGIASCLTIKTKLSLPEDRTCFACPGEWIERWDLHNVDIPGGVRWQSPQSWDAKRSENWVAAWLQGVAGQPSRPFLTNSRRASTSTTFANAGPCAPSRRTSTNPFVPKRWVTPSKSMSRPTTVR